MKKLITKENILLFIVILLFIMMIYQIQWEKASSEKPTKEAKSIVVYGEDLDIVTIYSIDGEELYEIMYYHIGGSPGMAPDSTKTYWR